MPKPKIESDGRIITVRVPISIRQRGGRKVVLAPDGATLDTRKLFRRQIDTAMVKALARSFRWREMLESGKYGTIKDIAAAEDINHSYVARILRLSLLAPNIVESIVEGRHPPTLALSILMKCFAPLWMRQYVQVYSKHKIMPLGQSLDGISISRQARR